MAGSSSATCRPFAHSAPRDALIASSVDEENRGRAFGLEGVGDNAGAFLGPLLAAFLLYAVHADIRTIFYLAVIPGLLAFLMVVLVRERRVAVAAQSKIDIRLRRVSPKSYWKYLMATALFGIGNSSNSFLILRTQEHRSFAGADHPDLCRIQPCRRVDLSYPAGSLSDRSGRRNVLLASFVIFLIAYLGFALTQNILMIAGLFVFYGLYQGYSARSARRSRRISYRRIARQRRRLVQHERRAAGTRG